jgi:thiamine transporter
VKVTLKYRASEEELSVYSKTYFNQSTKIFAEMIVMIALSGALHLVKIFTFPQGGSITLGSMIPIILFSLRRGAKLGIVAGGILGLVILVLEPYIYHPAQVFLDYPLAFGALGIAGLFRNLPILGVGVAIAGRFISHFFSGIIFFASFAPEGLHPVLYSAIYNGSYLGVELVFSSILIYGLIKRNIITLYQ